MILCLAAGLVSWSGCYYDNEEELYEHYYNQNKCDTAVTFSNTILPIIKGNCAISGCHVAGGSGNGIFENYDNVKAKVDNGTLRNRVLVQKDMPPAQPLNDCQLQQIEIWLDEGAPDN